ncbi:alpha/beta hydrolase family protein [Niveibacterium microcysteis]|uniref:Dienelactone hydrolase n=1 Tax=Niveibacterium microcysteis TaxID=2811415 RepID=A0ABX7MCB2_9RHOO|nr:hypothetical protein [Niveibacterium microcysteis]QSI78526.1 hypothetical protein JY500_07910 [Niveibacterium microcysteis]
MRTVFALLCAGALMLPSVTLAAVGLSELPATSASGPLTLLYPSRTEAHALERAGFHLQAAVDGPPDTGNGKLIAISHGSPAPVWVYFDLARALVEAGYVVVLPEHAGDNPRDGSAVGLESWKRRPQEVSAAIDRVATDARFARTLDFAHVGVYGMSAGGLTALSLVGGRWSPARLKAHCERHITEDFHACAGPAMSLDGGAFDGLKRWVVGTVLAWKLDDAQAYGGRDPRVAAAVVDVPFAAHFDPQSLREISVPVGIISAQRDRWLNPRYHSEQVLQHCPRCSRLLDLPTGGHGALLSPLPDAAAAAGSLVADPPDFDRPHEVPRINAAIVDFFKQNLPR